MLCLALALGSAILAGQVIVYAIAGASYAARVRGTGIGAAVAAGRFGSFKLGLKVVVWTVNSPENMARLIDLGVDGIISDRPDVLRAIVAKKGIAPPPPAPVSP